MLQEQLLEATKASRALRVYLAEVESVNPDPHPGFWTYGIASGSPLLALATLAAFAPLSVAANQPSTYSDPGHRFHFTIPNGCASARGHAGQSDVVSCGNGTAFVLFAAGATDKRALQRLVNHIIGGWTNLSLISNSARSTLDDRPARTIFAVAVRPDRDVANIEIVAVAKDKGWYAVVTESSTWSQEKRSFRAFFSSFRFDSPRKLK